LVKSYSVLRLAAAAGLALLAAGSIAPASAQPPLLRSSHRRPEPKPTVRTSRDMSQIGPENLNKFACTVVPNKELFITDVSVVDDCFRTTWFGACPAPVLPATRGAWTFGRLMEGLFGTTNPATLSAKVTQWLNEWNVLKVVNGENVPARTAVQTQIINPWLAKSGGVQLDMKQAPFRLLAIVSRLDLRQNTPSFKAGEGRFVFNLLDSAGNTTQYLLIIEYGLDAPGCSDVLTWANQWHNLGTLPFGPNYNAALQTITDRFTTINSSPAKPNGSSLDQLRTDEIFLAAPWELREFTLQPGTTTPAPLLMSTVAQTPENARQNSVLLANYVNANTAAILANNYTVPLSFGGLPFLGGASTHTLNFNWDGPAPACSSIGNPNARFNFSLNTCNGCHGAETATTFKQVLPRNPGVASALSNFLTGAGPAVTDMCGIVHTFNDLGRRQADLCNLLSTPCPALAAEPAINFVH
jgi:hypothetical protein